MKGIKIRYTRQELWHFFKAAVLSALTGLSRILWAVVLLVANTSMWLVSAAVRHIRKSPCVSVCATFAVMLLVTIATNMQMKARLTTAEWQRDSFELRLDSVLTLHGDKNGYYKHQPYR